MIHFWAADASRLQVHAQPGENAIDPFSRASEYPNRLREIEAVKHRCDRSLRQALHAQVPVGGNFANHVPWLVHRHRDQPVRRATANRHVNVAQVVGLRAKRFQSLANRRSQALFMTRNRNRKSRFDWRFLLDPGLAGGELGRGQQHPDHYQWPANQLLHHGALPDPTSETPHTKYTNSARLEQTYEKRQHRW